MIEINIQNAQKNNRKQSIPTFKSKENALVDALHSKEKIYYNFIKQRENLSSARFIQDVTTNWIPKAVFVRSLADFTEMTFLEYTESALFYFVPMLLSGLFRRIFSKFSPKELQKEVNEHIAKPTEELLKQSKLANNNITKRVLPAKAAIVLACVSIPAAEYALSFAKNLLTLKVFKKSDFNNVVNLNKGSQQVECKEHQEKVRKSATQHIKDAALLSAASLTGSFILATAGHKSKNLQKVSKGILRPGEVIYKFFEKFGVKSEKVRKNLNTYINFDCDIKDGKPILSKGQLVVSTVAGFFGYSAAGKDRGKLDQLEVLTRVPIVVLYTIFGSDVFDWAFKHILLHKNKYPDLIKRKPNSSAVDKIPESHEIEEIAKKIAKKKNVPVEQEFKRLVKEKAVISTIPYGFSLLFMGFLLAGISRFWTQYRYNHQIGRDNNAKQHNKSNKIENSSSDNKVRSTKKTNYFSWMN